MNLKTLTVIAAWYELVHIAFGGPRFGPMKESFTFSCDPTDGRTERYVITHGFARDSYHCSIKIRQNNMEAMRAWTTEFKIFISDSGGLKIKFDGDESENLYHAFCDRFDALDAEAESTSHDLFQPHGSGLIVSLHDLTEEIMEKMLAALI